MSNERNTRENIERTTDRIVDSSKQHGQTVDRARVREQVRQSFIRNERTTNHHK